MNRYAAKRLANFYAAHLRALGHAPVRDEGRDARTCVSNDHLYWMCLEILYFVDDGKIHRWLGFIQGVLCAQGVFSIEELIAHAQDAIAAFEPGDLPHPEGK